MMQAEKPIRIVAVDDHPIARRGVRELLAAEPDIEIVAEGADSDVAESCVAEHQPDVAVLDLFMPGRRPVLALLPELRDRSPHTKVVILTMQHETVYVRKALQAGACGYVLKDGADEDLVDAIRSAARGERWVNPRLAQRLATEAAAVRPGGLSQRQLEILKLLALGHTNVQIAGRLSLSVRTVETHRAHIQEKLDVVDRHGLVAFALSNGLIGSVPPVPVG